MVYPTKPYIVKKAEGNRGHRRLNPGPAYKGDFGSAPSWIGPHGKKLWRQLVPQLTAQGLAANVYRTALLGLCSNYNRVVVCEIVLAEKGTTFDILKEAGVDEQGNPKFVCTYVAQRPEVGIALKSWDKVKSFGALFGFSPADVQKIAPKKPEEIDLRDELMA